MSTIDAIKELLRLKDLKERLEACEFAGPLISSMSEDDYKKGRADYLLNKGQAWDNVRATIAHEETQATDEDSVEYWKAYAKSSVESFNVMMVELKVLREAQTAPPPSAEREALIAKLMLIVSKLRLVFDADLYRPLEEAADLLAADAGFAARERHTRETLRKVLAGIEAQQVTVPQEMDRDHPDFRDVDRAYAVGWNNCRATMLAAAPQPPQGDKPWYHKPHSLTASILGK